MGLLELFSKTEDRCEKESRLSVKLAEVKGWGTVNERETVGRSEKIERKWPDLQVLSVMNKKRQSLQ